jgi:hypothetical protein
LGLFLCLTLALTACAGTPSPTDPVITPDPDPDYDVLVTTGAEFQLPLGQTAHIDETDVYITFAEVLNDNRCPQGAQCIVAGQVTVRLEFTDDTGTGEVEIFHPGPADHLLSEVWNGHRFDFEVGPFPVVDQQIAPASYYLRLKFTG